MRRLAGQDQAQPPVAPRPLGSEASRRAIMLPACVQLPQKIQLPQLVLPSPWRWAKVASCSPSRARNLPFSFGSGTSARAEPLSSRASSSGEGSAAILYGQLSLRTGSGRAPPSFWYSSRSLRNSAATMAASGRASPGGSAPFQCHCSQRPELTSDPFSSAKQVEGSRKTSVLMAFGSTSLNSPWFCQKSEVSVESGSMETKYLSRDRASTS